MSSLGIGPPNKVSRHYERPKVSRHPRGNPVSGISYARAVKNGGGRSTGSMANFLALLKTMHRQTPPKKSKDGWMKMQLTA